MKTGPYLFIIVNVFHFFHFIIQMNTFASSGKKDSRKKRLLDLLDQDLRDKKKKKIESNIDNFRNKKEVETFCLLVKELDKKVKNEQKTLYQIIISFFIFDFSFVVDIFLFLVA